MGGHYLRFICVLRSAVSKSLTVVAGAPPPNLASSAFRGQLRLYLLRAREWLALRSSCGHDHVTDASGLPGCLASHARVSESPATRQHQLEPRAQSCPFAAHLCQQSVPMLYGRGFSAGPYAGVYCLRKARARGLETLQGALRGRCARRAAARC